MDLLDVRQKFIQLSGREDLATTVSEDYDVDAGADFFINAGSRWLDLIIENPFDGAVHEESLTVGDYKADVQNCRAVKEVWTRASDGERTELEYKNQRDLRALYPKWDSTDSGTPAYWTVEIARRAPSQVASGLATDYKRVAVLPPTDTALTLEVYGVFHANPLSDNADENFWSVNYPDALVFAALRSLEASYRNTQGVRDWEEAVASIITGIDRDEADQATADSLQMKG